MQPLQNARYKQLSIRIWIEGIVRISHSGINTAINVFVKMMKNAKIGHVAKSKVTESKLVKFGVVILDIIT